MVGLTYTGGGGLDCTLPPPPPPHTCTQMQVLNANPKVIVLANISGWGVNGSLVTVVPEQLLLYAHLIPSNYTPPAMPPSGSSSSSLSSGAVAGVVVGCIVGAALLLLLGGLLLLRCVLGMPCYCWGACCC